MTAPERMEIPQEDDFSGWLALLGLSCSPELLDRIALFLAEYLRENGLSSYILGVSGGVDSAFLAALMHARSIPFLPFSLVIEGNAPEEVARAEAICTAYGSHDASAPSFEHLHNLTPLYASISSLWQDIFHTTTPVAEGNIKARCRMIFLYHAAQLVKGCVLSTDQLDELLTGFWTLHGDVGEVAPLQLIPKTVEYELAHILCHELDNPGPLQAAMAATPTDGLGISASDLEQLGVASYKELEELFQEYFSLKHDDAQASLHLGDKERLCLLEQHTVIKRYKATSFKRQGLVVLNPL